MPNIIEHDRELSKARKAMQLIANYIHTYKDDELSITMSFGVGEFKREMDIDKCVKFADEELYKAKESGRNMVMP